MTKHELEVEISRLLNAAPRGKHREVRSDTVYALCVGDRDMEKAFERAYAIIFGEAGTVTEMRRLRKRQRRKEKELEFI